MSIFRKTMKALGFSGEDDEFEAQPYTAENITNACIREKERQDNESDVTPSASRVGEDKEEELQLPDTLLDTLLELLNKSLPDYILAALDKEAEKKYLFDRLDKPFKEFICAVNERARESVSRKWKTEHLNLTKEMEEARVKMKELEEQRNTMQSAQLSAERQKRAVAEKVHELEARIAALEAEKEQFELENKSLVNKLKVSNVHQEELEAASAEIERLRAELKTQKENISDVEQLRMDLQQARKELSQAKDKETEIASQLEAARQDLMQREDKNSQLLKQIKELEIQLSEAQNGLKVVDEVEIKLQQIEQIKASKDEKIAQLLDNLQSVEEENKQLQARLNDLIEQKEKLEQAVTQGNVGNKNEIESLKSDLENANAMVAALRNQRQELLAQIENLKFVKNTNEKQEPETVTPVEEKQDTSSVISFEVRQDESETKSNVKTSVEESKEVTENSPKSVDTNTGEDDFPGLDSFDDNWLIPTRPDTPEMIAKRKEEEKKKREAEEQAAVEQKKAQQVDSSQMSLW